MSSESDGSELIAMKSIFMRAHCDKGGRPKGMASDEKCARSDKSVVFQQARTHERSCGAIVFEEMEGALHVLMIQHRAGHWSFPKGHMEKGESEHETAIREVREETGVEIEIASNFRGESTYSPRNGVSKTVAFFIGNRFGGTVRPQEGEVCAVHWMRAVDAVRLLTFDKDRAIFLNAFEHYLKHDRIYADDCHDLEKCGYERSSSDAFSLKERYTVDELLAIMAFLRSDEGCPWDRIQTHESIKGNFIEEAYEAVDAIRQKDADKLCEELGDVMMQVVFHGDEKLAELEALYASWEWRYGRAIDFDAQVESDRFTWGQADIRFKVAQGIIADTVIFSDALDSDFIDCIAQSLIGVPFTSRDMAERVKSLGSAKDTVGDISQTVIAHDIARTLLDEAF
jgi:bis(5'-nucleosidyl)-tetraphosphatase